MGAFILCAKGIARKKFNKMHIYYFLKTIQDSVSPVWEEPFRFLIHDPKYQELDIEVQNLMCCKPFFSALWIDESIAKLMSPRGFIQVGMILPEM